MRWKGNKAWCTRGGFKLFYHSVDRKSMAVVTEGEDRMPHTSDVNRDRGILEYIG